MAKVRRITSFFLALVMTLGVVFTPSPAFASNQKKSKEVKYKTEIVEGQEYKLYAFKDVFGNSITNKSRRKRSIEANSFSTKSKEPDEWEKKGYIRDAGHYKCLVEWDAFDISSDDLGVPVYINVRDTTTKKLIGQTDNISISYGTGGGTDEYLFKKLPAWDDPDVSHNPEDWAIRIKKRCYA